ncbi:DUF11 domain-containing protein [Candidatus Saccharibacteria bacterium]|nr:DUF11 domain-containing protein [Candidatus Saccharibacteria bacterium]
MKNTINSKKKIGIFGTVATVCASLLSVAAVSAWGPERATFTMEKPATYPTFNSITNNPTIGDERDFVRVGEINADVTDLKDSVEVIPGRQYLVYIYFHNNASATFNDSAHNHSGVAVKSRLASSFSTVLTPAKQGTITATITAENTNPTSVWDEAHMTTTTDKVLMHYVAGSAKIYNDWQANGSVMPSSLFTEQGTLIGLNALNGVIPGCEEYHGVVSYVLQAEELGGNIDKTVSKDGTNFNESANITPGEEVTFQLTIANTGDVALTNATIKDTLPAGLTLVPGSVGLRANDSTTVDPLSDNILGTGYNLGTIGTGNIVYITYKAVAGSDFDCTGTELLNNAVLTYDSEQASGDSKQDSATVIVKKADCDEPVPPLDDCTTNPALPECQNKNCATNPEMEGCGELPNTGPLEIVMAIIIIAGIAGGGYYFYRTRKTLKTVEGDIKGEDTTKPEAITESKTEVPESKDSSQKPDDVV